MRRFSWSEMRRYWESHDARWSGGLDLERDPEGLASICYAGAPLWLNRRHARLQHATFDALLARVPRGARALDVGCGAGRWCRELSARGYATTGIDLQPELIERNRERFPDIRFERVAIQDFSGPEPFDLVSSVTVLQHIPFDEQETAVARIRALLGESGGHVILLENVRDQAAHVFARPVEGWRALFERHGFRTLAVRRYDYSPFLRLVEGLRGLVARALGRSPATRTPEEQVAAFGKPGAGARAANAARRAAVALDGLIEPLLMRANPTLPTVHAGFLFEAA